MSSWDDYHKQLATKAQVLVQASQKESKSCRNELEHAANAIEWTVERKFLNVPQIISKYTRQYQIIRDTFGLYCPICNSTRPEALDCWNKTQMELESQVLLRWRDDYHDDVCPKCASTKQELIAEGMLEPIDTLIGIAGMRSSKSVLCGIIATYIEHKLAIIGDANQYFDVLPGDPLQVSFVATTQTQSKDTIFAKYRALRKESLWLKKYVAWVKEKEKNQVVATGMRKWEYSEEADGVIRNGLLNIDFKALNSNSSGLAGATRIAAFMDELSRFLLTDSVMSADEVVKVMSQGLMTVRGNRDRLRLPPWWGMFAAVSSPISIDDQAMMMMRQGKIFAAGSISAPVESLAISGQYSFHYPTWSMNPDLPRSAFDGNFLRDSVGASRDFGAQPPTAASPYVDDEARFRQAIDFKLRPSTIFKSIEPVDKTNRVYVGAQVSTCDFDPYNSHYLHFDAGASFDTFAGASAHGEWVQVKDPQTGLESRKYVTVFDWVLGIKPVLGKTLSEKRTVWFDCIVQILTVLQKSSKIAMVTFDRWNAEKLIQDIRNLGIQTENRSIKVENFMDFLRASYEGDVRMLPPRADEPQDPRLKNDAEKSIYELLRLERTPDLKRIYNPKKGHVHGMNSDDLAQAVVGAHINVQKSIVAISDSTSVKEVLRRENAGSSSYYAPGTNGEMGGGRISRGKRW